MMTHPNRLYFLAWFLAVISPAVLYSQEEAIPNCIEALVVELPRIGPPRYDIDGDGSDDIGAATIKVLDLIVEPDSTESVLYSINRLGEAANPQQDSLVLTCADHPNVIAEVWTWDTLGQGSSCTTYLLVLDNVAHCGSGENFAIRGNVVTENWNPVVGVNITLEQDAQQVSKKTRDRGRYLFYKPRDSLDYIVRPNLDEAHRNGLSTFDIVLITKHILGRQLLDSPYKMIAADVDNSGTISVADVLELRQVILGISDRFVNNTSWRFIPATYTFPDLDNPWQTEFPEFSPTRFSLEFGNISLGFIAIKIGDLNLSATTYK